MDKARRTYRENAVHGASANRLIVLIYDQIIQDLLQAEAAIASGDIERRTQLLNHAILVIAHLQSPLDFEKGGGVARNLDKFYNLLRQKLVAVQFSPSVAEIRQQIIDLQAVREAWIEVDRAESLRLPSHPVPSHAAGSDTASSRVDWKG
jgi:flagellar protein FliS